VNGEHSNTPASVSTDERLRIHAADIADGLDLSATQVLSIYTAMQSALAADGAANCLHDDWFVLETRDAGIVYVCKRCGDSDKNHLRRSRS
jgi:hypothetical protein